MTEKNIFAYKLFLSLSISDFSLFFMWKFNPPPTPPKKKSPLLSQQPPLKLRSCQAPRPFLKIWLGLNPPPTQQKGGAHYVFYGYPGREWVTDAPVKMLAEAGDNFFRAWNGTNNCNL